LDVRVEIDTGLEGATFALWDESLWDVGTWGSLDPNWTDISQYVLSASINAGATRWGERFDTATLNIVVDDTTGVFTPDSLVDAFHLPFRPGRRIRLIVVDTDEVKRPLFTGQIDATNDTHDAAGFNIETSIQCSDMGAVWAAFNPVMLEVATGVQMTDERVDAALDRFGYTGDRSQIQTGVHEMSSSALAQSTFEECQRAADAEGGIFYADSQGRPVFKSRDWLTTDTRSTDVQAWIGYTDIPSGSTGAHVLGLQISHEAARIVNVAQFARSGGEMQSSEDATSQTLFGKRSYQRTDFENNNDSELAFLAARHVAAFKDDRARVDSVSIALADNPDFNDLVYETMFGDRWSVRVATPWGWEYEKEVHVMGLELAITANDFQATFRLDDAQTFEGTF
jgi:hypothetical protein